MLKADKHSVKIRGISFYPFFLIFSIYLFYFAKLIFFDRIFPTTQTIHLGFSDGIIVLLGSAQILLMIKGLIFPVAILNDEGIRFRTFFGLGWNQKVWSEVKFVSSSRLSRFTNSKVQFFDPADRFMITIYSPDYLIFLNEIMKHVDKRKIDNQTDLNARNGKTEKFQGGLFRAARTYSIGLWILFGSFAGLRFL